MLLKCTDEWDLVGVTIDFVDYACAGLRYLVLEALPVAVSRDAWQSAAQSCSREDR